MKTWKLAIPLIGISALLLSGCNELGTKRAPIKKPAAKPVATKSNPICWEFKMPPGRGDFVSREQNINEAISQCVTYVGSRYTKERIPNPRQYCDRNKNSTGNCN